MCVQSTAGGNNGNERRAEGSEAARQATKRNECVYETRLIFAAWLLLQISHLQSKQTSKPTRVRLIRLLLR